MAMKMEEFAKRIIPPDKLGKIIILVNKRDANVDVKTRNLTDEDVKGVLTSVLKKYKENI